MPGIPTPEGVTPEWLTPVVWSRMCVATARRYARHALEVGAEEFLE